MKKALLSLAAVSLMTGANAQLLNYGFETEQEALLPGIIQTVNWENFVETSTFSLQGTDAYEGQYALEVVTGNSANRWERVVAFKGIAIEPMKSYRLSYMVKGQGQICTAIMQGDFDRDIPLVAGTTDNYVEQITSTDINNGEYAAVSNVFWSPSADTQLAYYNRSERAEELTATYFLRFSFTGAGNYAVDNIQLVESSIAGITFNNDVIAVDFGYATNVAKIAEAAGGTALMPLDMCTVKVNGEATEIESIECKKDGSFYIFLPEAILSAEDQVTVSFNNNGDLVYTTSTAPNCFEEANAAVLSFEAEAATFDGDLEASSFAWEEAEFVSSEPADGSFELDGDITTFYFNFNKPVLTNWDGDYATALLEGTNVSEQLQIVDFEGANTALTFQRPEGAATLAKGTYTITVENVYNEKGVVTGTPTVISLDFGKVTVSEITYTAVEGVNGFFSNTNANYPEGWLMYIGDSEVRSHTEAGGFGGSRGFDYTGSNVESAMYMRDWEGAATLTFGEVEGYELTIPAGDNLEMQLYSAGWGTTGTFKYTLIENNADSTVVFEQNVNVTVVDNKTRANTQFQKDGIRFTAKGGNYILKVQLANGSNELLFGGFQLLTYTESQGEKDESETLCDGSFADVQGNYIPAAGSGWRIHRGDNIRTPGANGGWGGNCVTGGGGPRIFALAYKGLQGKGCYLDGGTHNWLTYGEFLTYETTDEAGETVEMPEKVFALGAQKVQITYYSALWKADNIKLTMEIVKQEDGFDGTAIFTREDIIDTKSPSGDANADIDAMKTQFTWTCPEAGNYIIRFYTNGEGFVGNIKVETVASQAVQCKNLLKAALAEAQEELDAAMLSDQYAGTTRDALAQKIEEYTDPDFHTVKEYNDAIADLDATVKAMSARRKNMDAYPKCIESLASGLEAATGTKNENLEEYALVTEYYNMYKDIDPLTLSDADLADAVAKMGNLGTLLTNMVETCVPLLTQQITELAAAIVTLDENYYADNAILAADNALTDDQALVKGLKYLYNGLLYKKLAVENPFSVYDEEVGQAFADSIEMHFMIQNRNMYTDAQKQKTGALANESSFAGWNIEIVQNTILADWGWGGPYKCSETCPISEGAICTAWGTSEININQAIENLPVGKFTVAIGVADGTSKDSENLSFAFCQAGEATDTLTVLNDGGARSLTSMQFSNVAAAQVENVATVTIGAGLRSRGDFSKADEARIWMTGKDASFDYAAAADKLLEAAAEGIQLQERDDQPATVAYYDLSGRRIAAAQGVCIRIDSYADGYTVVRKVTVK